MSAMTEAEFRHLTRWTAVLVFLLAPGIDFVLLLVTYRVTAAVDPEVLGDVVLRPARYAALIMVVKLPMVLAWTTAVSGRRVCALVSGAELPEPPVRRGWRRVTVAVRDEAVDFVMTAAAALLVFAHVVHPVGVRTGPLVALSAAGVCLLPKPVTGLVALLRRARRRAGRRRPPGPPEQG
ncbi:hypothetical protein V6U81_02945 [Micromonospora sp. CPCC 205711]|uniref:hypothetical protein n=1 Tax=Micromonospora sp. CPCC 205547 TaxID=3122400 RepID=UPI002FEF2593